MRRMLLFTSLFLAVITYATGDAKYDLTLLQREFWNWRLVTSPEFATFIGVDNYNDRIYSFNHSLFDVRKTKVKTFLDQLSRIPVDDLNKQQAINYRILNDNLLTYIAGYKWHGYGSLNPINFLEGPQTDPSSVARSIKFHNRGDFENFIVRVDKSPNQIDEIIASLQSAIENNRTLHNVSINRISGQIDRILTDKPQQFPYYIPFNDTLGQLTSIPDSVKSDLRRRAQSSITKYMSSLKQLQVFINSDYLPRTRSECGVSSWPMGKAYYRACLKWHLSLDMPPEEVHQKGIEEVVRIHKQMITIITNLGYTMSVRDFFGYLKESGNFTISSANELHEGFKKLIKERINPQLQRVFDGVPDLPVVVEAMSTDGPSGQYISGSADGSRPGIFQVNLFRPEDQPTFDMMAITLHEVSPGHHLQASWVVNAKLPDFRKNPEYSHYYAVPFNFPFYTAYTEGWGLYAEFLGEEMNLYKDEYELLGRYSAEIFRACRLVVDTGLHYYGWSREKAIDYMSNYTAFSQSIIENEIDRYITWPGQACAYKIGEIKILELREKARKLIGEKKFNIKGFHSTILDNGPMPLNVLESIVDDWITEEQSKENSENGNCVCDNATNIPANTLSVMCIIIIIQILLSAQK